MSDGPSCPKCSSRANYSLHSIALFDDAPNSTWICHNCDIKFKQLYKLSGRPIEINEVDE